VPITPTVPRGVTPRRFAWLAVLLIAVWALFAGAPIASAAPAPSATSCNNILSGPRSANVQASATEAGLLITWNTSAFASPSGTVTVRACVVIEGGTNQGAISQNTANDGSELFDWSLFGLSSNPCPDDRFSFGGSVDSSTVQTQKSVIVKCGAAPSPSPSPSPLPSPSPSPLPSPSESPSALPSPSESPSALPSPSESPSALPSESPSPSALPSESPSPSALPSESPSPSALPSESPSPSALPSESPSPSALPSESPSPSALPSESPSPSVSPSVPGQGIAIAFKLDCDEDPGTEEDILEVILSDELPAGCELVEGVEFTATIDGEPVDAELVTNEDGLVFVTGPVGAEVVFTEDPDTATEGCEPRENPITAEIIPLDVEPERLRTQGIDESDLLAGIAVFVNICEAVQPSPTASQSPAVPSPSQSVKPALPSRSPADQAGVTPPATDTVVPTPGSTNGALPMILVGVGFATIVVLLLSPFPRRKRT
jgi:hypothetical protein